MKKWSLFVGLLVLTLALSSCARAGGGYLTVYPAMAQQYTAASKPDTSPEYAAWKAATLYQKMINGSLSVRQGYVYLVNMCADSAFKKMMTEQAKDEFISQISQTQSTLQADNDAIARFLFSKAIPSKNTSWDVSVYRIQINKSGKRYYFRQDLVRQNESWRIVGDNLVNNFAIR